MRGHMDVVNEGVIPVAKSSPVSCEKMTEDELWFEYKVNKSTQARDELILRYAPLAKVYAGQLVSAGTHLDFDECLSCGILGLIDAVDRFEPESAASFKHYAGYRIRGSIVDGMRKMGRVPESVYRNARRIEKVSLQLALELGRIPSDEEIASALRISLETYHAWVGDVACSIPLSLESPVTSIDEGEAITLLDTLPDSSENDPVAIAENAETRDALATAIDSLSDTERLVLTLYYYEELTLKEIGEVLGITESRVSQIHAKTILKLRGKLRTLFCKSRP